MRRHEVGVPVVRLRIWCLLHMLSLFLKIIDVALTLVSVLLIASSLRILQESIRLVKLSANHWTSCAEFTRLHHQHLLELVLELMATLAQVWCNHQALVVEGAVI